MPQALVITLADGDPPPIGSVIATDQDRDFPVVIAHTERPTLDGAKVVSVGDTVPPGSGTGGITDEQLLVHVNDTTPHPVYDDLPSLTLLFNNALV